LKFEEPILTEEDHRIWAKWRRVCLLHSQTQGYRRRVDRARAVIHEMNAVSPNAYASWSAGKDSTAMTHLIAQEIPSVVAMSIKDDCDYPGEREYIAELARDWGIHLDIVTPPFSLQQWLKDNDAEFGEDMHSRGGEFSDAAFYALLEQYRIKRGSPGTYIGLRKHESENRTRNRAFNGLIYRRRGQETVCQPICDWSDVDVFAYLFSNGVEPFHVYRCVRLADSPARIRKSWFIPPGNTSWSENTHCVWLKAYYPSLFNKLRNIMPTVTRFA
jgi:3'-phosphoadenosine 5'-phosphosulfate sulfotransferase (PAPS reductase)/FAD synthetase